MHRTSKLTAYALLLLMLPLVVAPLLEARAYNGVDDRIEGYVYENGVGRSGLTVHVWRLTNEHGATGALPCLEGTTTTDADGFFAVAYLYGANSYRVDVHTPVGVLAEHIRFLSCGDPATLTFRYAVCGGPELEVVKYFTDTCGQPIPDDTVTLVLNRFGRIQNTNPGGVLAWIEIRNTGSLPINSVEMLDTLPHGWKIAPKWLPAKSGVQVFILDDDATTQIEWHHLDVDSDPAAGTVAIAIVDITAAAGQPLAPGDTLKVRIKLKLATCGHPIEDPENVPPGVNHVKVTAYTAADCQGTALTAEAEATLHYTTRTVGRRCCALRWRHGHPNWC